MLEYSERSNHSVLNSLGIYPFPEIDNANFNFYKCFHSVLNPTITGIMKYVNEEIETLLYKVSEEYSEKEEKAIEMNLARKAIMAPQAMDLTIGHDADIQQGTLNVTFSQSLINLSIVTPLSNRTNVFDDILKS